MVSASVTTTLTAVLALMLTKRANSCTTRERVDGRTDPERRAPGTTLAAR
jgi:hypothetical protein